MSHKVILYRKLEKVFVNFKLYLIAFRKILFLKYIFTQKLQCDKRYEHAFFDLVETKLV